VPDEMNSTVCNFVHKNIITDSNRMKILSRCGIWDEVTTLLSIYIMISCGVVLSIMAARDLPVLCTNLLLQKVSFKHWTVSTTLHTATYQQTANCLHIHNNTYVDSLLGWRTSFHEKETSIPTQFHIFSKWILSDCIAYLLLTDLTNNIKVK
jgi:hypothetical protein